MPIHQNKFAQTRPKREILPNLFMTKLINIIYRMYDFIMIALRNRRAVEKNFKPNCMAMFEAARQKF